MTGYLKHLQINSKVNYYVLNNNFFYTQLAFTFIPQKVPYYIQDDTEAFFLFLL